MVCLVDGNDRTFACRIGRLFHHRLERGVGDLLGMQGYEDYY
jgi:hypothetical protein